MNLIAYTLDSGLFTYLGENGVKSATVYYLLYFLLAVVCMAVSYLLGSLNAGIIVSKLVYRDDVRKYGSGNAGMTNVMRTLGWLPGFLAFAGDEFLHNGTDPLCTIRNRNMQQVLTHRLILLTVFQQFPDLCFIS